MQSTYQASKGRCKGVAARVPSPHDRSRALDHVWWWPCSRIARSTSCSVVVPRRSRTCSAATPRNTQKKRPTPEPRPVPGFAADDVALGDVVSTSGRTLLDAIRSYANENNIGLEGVSEDPDTEGTPERVVTVVWSASAALFALLGGSDRSFLRIRSSANRRRGPVHLFAPITRRILSPGRKAAWRRRWNRIPTRHRTTHVRTTKSWSEGASAGS